MLLRAHEYLINAMSWSTLLKFAWKKHQIRNRSVLCFLRLISSSNLLLIVPFLNFHTKSLGSIKWFTLMLTCVGWFSIKVQAYFIGNSLFKNYHYIEIELYTLSIHSTALILMLVLYLRQTKFLKVCGLRNKKANSPIKFYIWVSIPMEW